MTRPFHPIRVGLLLFLVFVCTAALLMSTGYLLASSSENAGRYYLEYQQDLRVLAILGGGNAILLILLAMTWRWWINGCARAVGSGRSLTKVVRKVGVAVYGGWGLWYASGVAALLAVAAAVYLYFHPVSWAMGMQVTGLLYMGWGLATFQVVLATNKRVVDIWETEFGANPPLGV